jgi:hypothetical protein
LRSAVRAFLHGQSEVAAAVKVNTAAVKENSEVLLAQNELLKQIRADLDHSRGAQEAVRYALTTPLLNEVQEWLASRQEDQFETLRRARERRIGVARFGDGEFRLLLRPEWDSKFQRNSPALRVGLQRTLQYGAERPDRLIVAVPPPSRDRYWTNFYTSFWAQLQPAIEPLQTVGDSFVTRPNFFRRYRRTAVDAWRELWDGCTVTIVTGEGSRFELSPGLFDNIATSRFVHSKPTHAFDDLDRVLEVLEGDGSDLVLIALGPAGTILAAELAKRGRWALDVGHVSNSYESALNGGIWPEDMPLVRSDGP